MINLTFTAQRILLRAAQLIGYEHRWIKGRLIVQTTGGGLYYCALGAIALASSEVTGQLECPESLEVSKAVARQMPAGHSAIYTYNDHTLTQHKDVKAMFCKAVAEEVDSPALAETPKEDITSA